MKTLSTYALFLALACGISVAMFSPAWAQQNPTFGDTVPPQTWGPDVVGTFSAEPNSPSLVTPSADEMTATHQPDFDQRQTHQGSVGADDNQFKMEKKAGIFGVDPDECRDEWAGMCDCKSPEYRCRCKELKSQKRTAWHSLFEKKTWRLGR